MARDRQVNRVIPTNVRIHLSRPGMRRTISREQPSGVPPRKNRTRESLLVDRGLTYLNGLVGCYARKTHGNGFSSGWPDIVGCYAGHFFGIECKRVGETVTKLQAIELARWTSSRGHIAIAYSLDDIYMFMQRFHIKDGGTP